MSGVKKRILREAMELFGRRGFERVTVRDIANAAEITMPTLYHHFGDKRALYQSVTDEALLVWTDEVCAAIEAGADTVEDMLFRLIYANMRQITDATSHSRVVDRVLLDAVHNDDQVGTASQIEATTMGLVRRALHDLVPDDDLMDVMYMMMATAYGAGKLLPIQRKVGAWEGHTAEVELVARRLAALCARFLMATYGGGRGPPPGRLEQLEGENARLKILLGDAILQVDRLQR